MRKLTTFNQHLSLHRCPEAKARCVATSKEDTTRIRKYCGKGRTLRPKKSGDVAKNREYAPSAMLNQRKRERPSAGSAPTGRMNSSDSDAPRQGDPGPRTRQITAVSSKRTRKSSLDQNQAGRAGEPPATKNASPLAYAGTATRMWAVEAPFSVRTTTLGRENAARSTRARNELKPRPPRPSRRAKPTTRGPVDAGPQHFLTGNATNCHQASSPEASSYP